jgi:uncharacterized protein YjiS (DUF1127 family)
MSELTEKSRAELEAARQMRSDVFAALRRHDVSDDLFAEVAAITHGYISALPLAPAEPVGEAWVERVAQFLHDEGGFSESYTCCTWPEHPNDTGQREGGFVKIVPSDAQAHFRDVARRLATLAHRAARWPGEAGLVEALREVLDGHGFLSGGDWELEDIGISQNRGAEIRALLARIEGESA